MNILRPRPRFTDAASECRKQLAEWEAIYRQSLTGLLVSAGVIPAYRQALGMEEVPDLLAEAVARIRRDQGASECSTPGCRAPVWPKDRERGVCFGHHPSSQSNPSAFAAWAARHAAEAPELVADAEEEIPS